MENWTPSCERIFYRASTESSFLHLWQWAVGGMAVLALAIAVGPAAAQEPLLDAHLSTAIDFPNTLTFQLSARVPVVIDRAEVVYQVEELSCGTGTASGLAQFAPTNTLNVSWEWDLRDAGGIPVGAKISYRWMLSGAGRTFETPLETLVFEDPRFDWRTVTGEHTRLKWYAGGEGFANDLLQVAEEGIVQLESSTGVLPTDLVEKAPLDGAFSLGRSRSRRRRLRHGPGAATGNSRSGPWAHFSFLGLAGSVWRTWTETS